MKTPLTSKKNRLFRIARTIQNKNTAWIILVVSLLLTISASWLSYYYSTSIAKQRFKFRATEITEAIKFRMNFYEQALWGTVGFFNANKEVGRTDFHDYVKTIDVEKRLPGIQGIGYSVWIKKAEKNSFVTKVRQEGFLDFSIQPEGDRDQYSSIIFLEPFDWRNKRAFGYDMWSNEMRRNAMRRALNSGLAATSGIITLVQETDKDIQKGFLMYLPVYKTGSSLNSAEDRINALNGWVYSPFRAGDLMKGVHNDNDQEYEIELFDKTMSKESLLFDSDSTYHLAEPNHKPYLYETINLNVQGRNWKLYIHTKPNILSKTEARLPLYIGIFGLVIDLILFLVIFSIYELQTKTKELAKNLEAKKSDLESANIELSQFAYIASHDLQEPLRTVINFVGLLEEDYEQKLDNEGKYFLTNIKKATKRMSQLILDILEYSRLGKAALKLDKIDCTEVITEITTELNALIIGNGAEISLGTLPVIMGNRRMIKQLFTNLISNAIKYRKEEVNPFIIITGESHLDHHKFKVKDNGIGIDQKHKKKIFQIFQRLHNKSQYEGTGIGLSICKKIIQIHNGHIEAHSTINQGSDFVFTIAKKPH